MPDAPAPVIPAYTPGTPTAPAAVQSGGIPTAPTAPDNSVGSGAIAAPAAPVAVQDGGQPSAPTAPSAPIDSDPPLAPTAATLLINPDGSDNSIMLTAKSPGDAGNSLSAGLVVGDISEEPYDNSAPSILLTGSYALISGPAYRMRITGNLAQSGLPITIPDLIAASVTGDRSAWSQDGSNTNGIWRLFWFGSSSCWLLTNLISSWASFDDVQSPALCTSWEPQGATTGTPIITPLAASAAQMITKITATTSLPFTASNSPASDGSGAVAQVEPAYFTGGSGPIAPTSVQP